MRLTYKKNLTWVLFLAFFISGDVKGECGSIADILNDDIHIEQIDMEISMINDAVGITQSLRIDPAVTFELGRMVEWKSEIMGEWNGESLPYRRDDVCDNTSLYGAQMYHGSIFLSGVFDEQEGTLLLNIYGDNEGKIFVVAQMGDHLSVVLAYEFEPWLRFLVRLEAIMAEDDNEEYR